MDRVARGLRTFLAAAVAAASLIACGPAATGCMSAEAGTQFFQENGLVGSCVAATSGGSSWSELTVLDFRDLTAFDSASPFTVDGISFTQIFGVGNNLVGGGGAGIKLKNVAAATWVVDLQASGITGYDTATRLAILFEFDADDAAVTNAVGILNTGTNDNAEFARFPANAIDWRVYQGGARYESTKGDVILVGQLTRALLITQGNSSWGFYDDAAAAITPQGGTSPTMAEMALWNRGNGVHNEYPDVLQNNAADKFYVFSQSNVFRVARLTFYIDNEI